MSHEQWQDSVAPYLLGALPDHERVGFEAHAAGCDLCRDELDHLRVAAEALPASPEQLDAPPELKDRIMTIVHREAALLGSAGAAAPAAPAAERRPWWRGLWTGRPAVALAAVALMVGVVTTAVLTSSGDDDGAAAPRTIVAQVEPAGATAHLAVHEDGSVELVTHDLPDPGPASDYQVWVKRPGQDPQPTDALFDAGDGATSVRVPGPLEGVEAVLVTREPAGGSAKPSGPPLITAGLT